MQVKRKYPILVGPIPEWMFGLRENENFIPIKDEIRAAVWRPKMMTLHPEPRVILRDGLAWFDLEDYDNALITHEILQGRYWRKQGIRLNAYVLQQDGRRVVQLRGPIESGTGQMLRAPVPLSPPMVPLMHRQRGQMGPTRSHPVSSQRGHASSNDNGGRERNVQPLAAGAFSVVDYFDQVSEAPTNAHAGIAGDSLPLQQQSVQRSEALRMMPAFLSSSRKSSVSTPSTVTISPDTASFDVTLAFSSPSSALGTPHKSRNPSFSNASLASTTSRSCGLIATPPPTVGKCGSEHPSPAAIHGHKVTIRNLSQETTKERVYNLVEEMTHAFVQMIQPGYITLRQVHGQLRAYVEFIREKDAEMAVQKIHGYKFMGRTLQATLG